MVLCYLSTLHLPTNCLTRRKNSHIFLIYGQAKVYRVKIRLETHPIYSTDCVISYLNQECKDMTMKFKLVFLRIE